jgi:hypothetical protein
MGCYLKRRSMSYIIYAEFPLHDEINLVDAKDKILLEDGIRLLSDDKLNSTVTVDMHGDFKRQAEITMDLCEKLIRNGILRFTIGHSF